MPDPRRARSFSNLLSQIGDGQLHDRTTEAYRKAVEALNECEGGVATITVKIKLKLDRGAVEVEGKVTTTIPEPKHERTILYPTPEGFLTSAHPKQEEMAFRDVSAPPAATSFRAPGA